MHAAPSSSVDGAAKQRRRFGRADIEREFRQGLVASIDFEDPQDAEHASACDLGMPDSEICSGLSTPPIVLSSLQEAYSRGWVGVRAARKHAWKVAVIQPAYTTLCWHFETESSPPVRQGDGCWGCWCCRAPHPLSSTATRTC